MKKKTLRTATRCGSKRMGTDAGGKVQVKNLQVNLNKGNARILLLNNKIK